MKKLIILFICTAFTFSTFAQEEKKKTPESCASINHEVMKVSPCKISTNTSVDVIWKLNCPNHSKAKKGVTIKAQFLNKNGDWNYYKTESISSGVGEIRINFSGLRFNTTGKIRWFAYPEGYNPGVDQITKEEKWEDYSFNVEKICK